MSKIVSESQFYMWRTLFAVVHADNVVTDEEVNFMSNVFDSVNFSETQIVILKDDIVTPKDINEMFDGVSVQEDRVKFFELAHDLVWVDGDFAEDEQNAMVKLFKTHFNEVDFDALVGKVPFELEIEKEYSSQTLENKGTNNSKMSNVISSFKRLFS